MVLANGIFEVVAALLLGIGLWVRPLGIIMAAQLFIIALSFGTSATAIRDYGLAFATLATALFGPDELSYKKELSA